MPSIRENSNYSDSSPLLRVTDLAVNFHHQGSAIPAVQSVSFDLYKNQTLAIVGESGSGKSVTALSILRLLPYPKASHPSGRIEFRGQDLLRLPETELRQIRGARISMIFQEPMTSLNPLLIIQRQISEALFLHRQMTAKEARARVIELLELVGIPEPEKRLTSYPHELSCGQKQRVMIAMALANEPDLLIADEPTTALDVTVQSQILHLLKQLQQRLGMAMLFITHDLGIVRQIADRVCVMTNGDIVETGPVAQLFAHPHHAYTRHLLSAEPRGTPPPSRPEAPEIVAVDDLKVWFPVKRGLLRRTVG